MPDEHGAKERSGSQIQIAPGRIASALGESNWAYYIALSVVVILLVALGWYIVMRQTETLTEMTIDIYQQVELEIVRVTARGVEQYVYDQTEIHGRTDIVEIEQEIIERFIAPIFLLEHSDAWIYAPDHVVFGHNAVSTEYQGKSMVEIFALQAENGASHYEEMMEATTNAREGVGWYIWSPDEGKEIAAWTPVRVGEYSWTIGLSTPLSEILAYTGVAKQTRTRLVMMGMGTLFALFLLLFAGSHGPFQRRQTESALWESENKFRQAFHYANDAMYLWTLYLDETPNRCIEVNDVACHTLGYSRDEFATMSPRDILTAKSGRELDGIVRELVAKEQITFETVLVTKDGREIPAEISAHVFISSGENIVLGIVRDITERKRAEETLRELNVSLETRVTERTIELQAQYARLDAILNSTADGIVVTDRVGDIIQANPVAQAWFTQTLSPQEASLLREMVRRVALRTGESTVELLELAERGLDLELSGAPIWEPEIAKTSRHHSKEPEAGHPAMVVAIHDVSQLKMLDRMKTLFVANVSDELSQPVTTIKAFVYLVQAMALDNPKLSNHLDTLSKEVDYLEQMVEYIRRIYAVYTGRLRIESSSLSLDKLTKSIIVNHRYLAQTQGVTLDHQPTELEPVALADPDQVVQVLNCLVGDAVRYTPEGGQVVVSTGIQEADGQLWATVAVSDTGEMIPEEDKAHIFERFFRDEEPRNRRVSETGLRLMLAGEIVTLLKGRLTVESPSPVLSVDGQDVGSTFTVWLALAE